MIGNMVSGMNDQANAASHPLFDPREMEGSNNSQAMNFGGSGTTVGTGTTNKWSGPSNVVVELNSQTEYNEAIAGNTLCVIDVFTTWCGPCQAIKLFYGSLPPKYKGIRFFKVKTIF